MPFGPTAQSLTVEDFSKLFLLRAQAVSSAVIFRTDGACCLLLVACCFVICSETRLDAARKFGEEGLRRTSCLESAEISGPNRPNQSKQQVG